MLTMLYLHPDIGFDFALVACSLVYCTRTTILFMNFDVSNKIYTLNNDNNDLAMMMLDSLAAL
jgi:hypothetical protein